MHFRHLLSLAVIVSVVAATAAFAADAPDNLAGIELGGMAAKLKTRIRTHKPRPVPGAPWLYRMPVVPDKTYSGGYVLVGTCADPGRIVRIKLYYRDTSLEAFRKASGELLSQYGDPAEYKGEFDGRTMGNKWSFTDAHTKPISLILQRTEGEDPETGTGNTVKLTNWGMLEAERACWQEHKASHAKAATCPITRPADCEAQ